MNTSESALRSALSAEQDKMVEPLAAHLASIDGLNWDERCPYEEDFDRDCDSGTCIAAFWEDHDPELARSAYRRHAAGAISHLLQSNTLEKCQ